jgi:hypothetical protein
MCPLCIGTATLLISSGTSAGGLATFLFRRRAVKKRRGAGRAAARDGRDGAAARNRILLRSARLVEWPVTEPSKDRA